MMKLTIYGNVPSKSNCYRIIALPGKLKRDGRRGKPRGSLAKTEELKTYELNFDKQLTGVHRKHLTCKITAHLDVYYDSERPDLDNALKTILDCLQKGCVIANDRQVRRIIAERFLDRKNPRVEITLTEYVAREQQMLFPPSMDEVRAWVSAFAPERMADFILSHCDPES